MPWFLDYFFGPSTPLEQETGLKAMSIAEVAAEAVKTQSASEQAVMPEILSAQTLEHPLKSEERVEPSLHQGQALENALQAKEDPMQVCLDSATDPVEIDFGSESEGKQVFVALPQAESESSVPWAVPPMMAYDIVEVSPFV